MTERRPRLRLLIAYAILAAPLVVYGAMRAMQGNSNSPIDWVTSQFAPRADYDAFCELFGPGDVVVMSWPGATIDEPRLDQLVQAIRSARVFHAEEGGWLFERVVSGREAIADLTRPLGAGLPTLSAADAAERLRAHLIGPDGKTTAVVVTFNARGLRDRDRLVELLRQAAADLCEAPKDEIHLAGPVVDGLSVDRASQATLSKYAAPSALVVLVLCWFHLRSVRAAVVVFGLAAFCQAATLALVHYSGDSMNALLIVLPPLIQVLAVAGGVHLTNYYFDACTRLDPQTSAHEAFRRGWLPCTLSVATTAIGMASLAASQLSPVRSFGAYAALGVLLSGGILLGLLPACYTFWTPRQDNRGDSVSQPHELEGRQWPARWARALQAQGAMISLVGLLAVAVGGWYAAPGFHLGAYRDLVRPR